MSYLEPTLLSYSIKLSFPSFLAKLTKELHCAMDCTHLAHGAEGVRLLAGRRLVAPSDRGVGEPERQCSAVKYRSHVQFECSCRQCSVIEYLLGRDIIRISSVCPIRPLALRTSSTSFTASLLSPSLRTSPLSQITSGSLFDHSPHHSSLTNLLAIF